MSNRDFHESRFDLLQWLRALHADAPSLDDHNGEQDEAAILERLRSLDRADDDAWVARSLEHENWIGHVLHRLNGAEQNEQRSPGSPLSHLLDALSQAAVDMGVRAGLTQCALDARQDLEPAERELLELAVRDAASAGARAWARIDQALCLLATIDRGDT